MNNFILYVHISPSNKLYIGITCKGIKRWGADGCGYCSQQLFYRAITKYGWENFKHIVLLENLSKEEAFICEEYLIAKYHSNDPKFGYNVASGGQCGQLGLRRTDEQRRHISEGHKGLPLTEAQRQVLQHLHENSRGLHRTADVKLKISKANSGKIRTDEMRLRMSEAQRHREPSSYKRGYHLSDEVKEKLRVASTGKKATEATKKRMSENNARYWKGKTRSQETRDKISATLTGRPSAIKGCVRSDETRQKISDSQKRRLKDVDLSGKNNGFYGKHHSPETIERIRQTCKERARQRKELSQNVNK